MSLFCNKQLVKNIQKSKKLMLLKNNRGYMSKVMIADIWEDQALIWFSKKAIANILSLKDAIALYQVTYDSNDKQFIFHWSEHDKSDMLF